MRSLFRPTVALLTTFLALSLAPLFVPRAALAQNGSLRAQELYLEALSLLERERLLDGRTKLLEALEEDPSFYPTHMMLAGYYIQHVGHFRLALRYILQGQELFLEQNGAPPYYSDFIRTQHADILSLLSQARLNLDNYTGALEVLDRYTELGYTAPWYPGTRAWVLMKLGRLDEAIRVARLGVFSQTDKGRNLNMLGILLSMKGEPESALEVFRDAIDYELSLASLGQPATPLNNSGEVYKELFEDRRAEAMWYQAKSLPDGCEHVLPSLNLTLLAIDHAALRQAEQSIETFLQCFAQFPLRNGEEHQALVHLAFGRISTHSGRPELGIAHLEDALEKVQWFGKIGTSSEDLRAAGLVSLAYSYRTLANHLALTPTLSLSEWLSVLVKRPLLEGKAWWLEQKALHILIEDLGDLEDLELRNTDSLLEYPTLGKVLRRISPTVLSAKLHQLYQRDSRAPAAPYYKSYLGESSLYAGYTDQGKKTLMDALSTLRPEEDVLLRIHLLATLAKQERTDSQQYSTLVKELVILSRASLPNYGLKLPVYLEQSSAAQSSELLIGPFTQCTEASWPFTLSISDAGEAEKVRVTFSSDEPRVPSFSEKGATTREAIRKLAEKVFSLPTGKRPVRP